MRKARLRGVKELADGIPGGAEASLESFVFGKTLGMAEEVAEPSEHCGTSRRDPAVGQGTGDSAEGVTIIGIRGGNTGKRGRVPKWEGQVGGTPCFCVSAGRKGVRGAWAVSVGSKGVGRKWRVERSKVEGSRLNVKTTCFVPVATPGAGYNSWPVDRDS